MQQSGSRKARFSICRRAICSSLVLLFFLSSAYSRRTLLLRLECTLRSIHTTWVYGDFSDFFCINVVLTKIVMLAKHSQTVLKLNLIPVIPENFFINRIFLSTSAHCQRDHILSAHPVVHSNSYFTNFSILSLQRTSASISYLSAHLSRLADRSSRSATASAALSSGVGTIAVNTGR